MARGYSGAFGHKLNAPYVFLPLCAIFLLGLLDWRRLRRVANLDLLFLLGFGVSHFFFNRAEIGVSVPLQYVPLRLPLRPRPLDRPARPRRWHPPGLAGDLAADRGAVPDGCASRAQHGRLRRRSTSATPAWSVPDRITHGEPIYANFPNDVSQGDTYGPVNYLAYVPFERIWPWSGTWDDLPAAHGAAVFFDLATFALLFLLGRRIRPGPAGTKLAATLAFGWAAYPYTAFALLSNSNDTLVAMLLVATLLVLARPAARGVLAALATLAKFAPAVLVPMLVTYRPAGPVTAGDPPPPAVAKASSGAVPPTAPPAGATFVIAFVLTAFALLLWPAIDPGLSTVWDRTIAYQAGRDSPFSIWAQLPSLEPLRIAILASVAALSLAFAFRPKEKQLFQVAALGTALLIGLQLTMHHWFYLYIVWFYPLLLISMTFERIPPRSRYADRDKFAD